MRRLRPGISLALAGGAALALAVCTVFAARPELLPGAAPTATPATMDGKALFLAKGCATCHIHAAVQTTNQVVTGPNLTHYVVANDATRQYLRRWLADPKAVKPTTMMPKLDLGPAEIDALIAFLAANTPVV